MQFIQASIDRGDWEPSELREIFWEELAEIADLNLRLTKQVWMSVTVKYSGTIEVPLDFDESELNVEGTPYALDITHRDNALDGQVTYDEFDIEVSEE